MVYALLLVAVFWLTHGGFDYVKQGLEDVKQGLMDAIGWLHKNL
jgi:hypothetical protein